MRVRCVDQREVYAVVLRALWLWRKILDTNRWFDTLEPDRWQGTEQYERIKHPLHTRSLFCSGFTRHWTPALKLTTAQPSKDEKLTDAQYPPTKPTKSSAASHIRSHERVVFAPNTLQFRLESELRSTAGDGRGEDVGGLREGHKHVERHVPKRSEYGGLAV
ncbi:hypothetical protein CCMSSC00406_0008147 [Pleurotus cornucopiae]|uniref:Uncharacterized protein n=1 Tax=Pleurotus cornucopiae TaxID=5321 RepID=A0ACB7INT9_PLECO|nr:hypothetical protein CCMSSC00406_0008147 [Pleurotus cornucopiae]